MLLHWPKPALYKPFRLCACLLLLLGLTLGGHDAMAAKKKGITDAEATKILTEADKDLGVLLIKTQNRQLLTPEDGSKMVALQVQLLEIAAMAKQPAGLAKVLYQFAVLSERREQYLNAAEYYDTLSQKCADTPFAAKAKLALVQLKRQHAAAFADPKGG
jgi:hypothetical protein